MVIVYNDQISRVANNDLKQYGTFPLNKVTENVMKP